MWRVNPEILLHPNIPKPLHGLNPRTILGQEWWDVERNRAYLSTDYHCLACGISKQDAIIHKWLEAHEYYIFDYAVGVITIDRIIPLCHACHNYIHNGRLKMMVLGGEISTENFWKIVEHGTKTLEAANLPNNPFMINVLVSLMGMLSFPSWAECLASLNYELPTGGKSLSWGDWRLSFNGKLYSPIHKSFQEWNDFYHRR